MFILQLGLSHFILIKFKYKNPLGKYEICNFDLSSWKKSTFSGYKTLYISSYYMKVEPLYLGWFSYLGSEITNTIYMEKHLNDPRFQNQLNKSFYRKVLF